jgi:hypothetical protein
MHDPMVVAIHIRRPFPERRTREARLSRWRWSPPFINAAGREFYFPGLITVWHVEPHGEDALRGECRGTRWKWHVHHWHVQWDVLQRWQRRFLTRCEWCGGGSRKGDQVHFSHQWDGPKQPLWRGERGLFHQDCSSTETAHRTCLCDNPGLDHGDYGQCAFCGKYRAWRQSPTIPDRYLASLPSGSRIPPDKRDWLETEWAKVRAERGSA